VKRSRNGRGSRETRAGLLTTSIHRDGERRGRFYWPIAHALGIHRAEFLVPYFTSNPPHGTVDVGIIRRSSDYARRRGVQGLCNKFLNSLRCIAFGSSPHHIRNLSPGHCHRLYSKAHNLIQLSTSSSSAALSFKHSSTVIIITIITAWDS